MSSIISSVGFNPQLRVNTIDHVAELVAYCQIQRFGLPLDDNSQVMIKRKAEAYFRQHDLTNQQQLEIFSKAINKILDPSPLQVEVEKWLKDKKEYDVVVQNLSSKGLKAKKPGLLLRAWWWMTSCGAKVRKRRLTKWQSTHVERVLPKAT